MNNNKKYLEIGLLFLIDIFSVVVTVGIASAIRDLALIRIYPSTLVQLTPESISFSLWVLLIWLFFFYYEGLYTRRFSFWDEIKCLWKVAFFSSIAALVIVSVGRLYYLASRSLIFVNCVTALVVLPVVRINAQRLLRRFGLFKRRVIIAGAGEIGKSCLKALKRESNYGYEVIGFVDDVPEGERTIEGVKVHRGLNGIERYIKPCRVSDIFIALPEMGREKLQELMNRTQLLVERVLFVPDLQSIPVIGTEIHHFFHDQIFALEVKNNLRQAYNIFLKRLFDMVVSLLLLIILLVPMLLFSLVILLESPGSPLFTQTRIGKKGKPFRVFKFRTMYEGAETRLKELLQNDEDAKRDWETHWKLKNDPRVTKIGNFLRKTSLDELPQLFNVLKGNMSLVGPRPYLPGELKDLPSEIQAFLNVWPGITGLWQVSGRSNTDYLYRVALDGWYVRNWSLWLDIIILLKTVKVVMKGDGAY